MASKIKKRIQRSAASEKPVPANVVAYLKRELARRDLPSGVAATGEQKRIAAISALQLVLEFLRAFGIKSRALVTLFEKLVDLTTHQPDEIFEKSAGHGLTISRDQSARNVLIAIAFKIITAGGTKNGNLTRDHGGRLLADELNKLGMTDKGRRFTSSRINNIYREVARKPRIKTENSGINSPRAVAKSLPYRLYIELLPRFNLRTSNKLDIARGLIKEAKRLMGG
jgi:hypothetical protein